MKSEDAEERHAKATVREDLATVREDLATVREDEATVREDKATVREDELVLGEKELVEMQHQVGLSAMQVYSFFRFIKWCCVVMAVLVIGAAVYAFRLQVAVDDVEDVVITAEVTSQQSREAAIEARNDLRDAMASLNDNEDGQPDLNNQAIIDALVAIARIEVFLCGGTCPERP